MYLPMFAAGATIVLLRGQGHKVAAYALGGAALGFVLSSKPPSPRVGASTHPPHSPQPPLSMVGVDALTPHRSRAQKKLRKLRARGFEARLVETPWATIVLTKTTPSS